MATYVDTAIAQFENVNSLRNYPFDEGEPLVDDLGRTIPHNVIVDLHLIVPADIPAGFAHDVPKVRMTSLHLSSSMVSACFAVGSGADASALSVTVSSDKLRPYVPYRMEKLVGSYDIGGIVTFGEMELPGFPETYLFRKKGIAVVSPCCISIAKPAQLRSFFDRRSGRRVSGDVRMSFSGYVETKKSGNSFRLSLENGAASELISTCSELKDSKDICGATPVKTINGVSPDEDGNIVLWFH